MYRTHEPLLKYGVPLLLVAGIALALWQVSIPWYVLLIIVPLTMVLLVLLVGKLALARESRQLKLSAESAALPQSPPPNGQKSQGGGNAPAATSPMEKTAPPQGDKMAK